MLSCLKPEWFTSSIDKTRMGMSGYVFSIHGVLVVILGLAIMALTMLVITPAPYPNEIRFSSMPYFVQYLSMSVTALLMAHVTLITTYWVVSLFSLWCQYATDGQVDLIQRMREFYIEIGKYGIRGFMTRGKANGDGIDICRAAFIIGIVKVMNISILLATTMIYFTTFSMILLCFVGLTILLRKSFRLKSRLVQHINNPNAHKEQ